MGRRGMPGMASGDSKPHSPLSKGHKQIAQQVLPSRHARAQLTGGDLVQRSMNNYAQQSPADANGASGAGMSIGMPPGIGT